MHELAIAQSIFDTVIREKRARDLDAVDKVGLRIGVLSDVLPDALTFSFDVICQDSELGGCRLDIESVPLTLTCNKCGLSSTTDQVTFLCPSCGDPSVRVDGGFELDIAYIEVPDPLSTGAALQRPAPAES